MSTTPQQLQSPAATIRSLSALLEDDGRTPMATAFSSRPASRSASAGLRGAGEQQLQGLLASKESEAVLLRQQLAQLTADFKFNLKLLEERDAELERVDAVMTGLREAAATREAALQEARHTLGCREAALRDKEARVAALEERQKHLVELCERQVADARASRDEEVARCQQEVAVAQSEAAKGKAEVIAGYERQVSAAAASEREARQRATALVEENEHVRSQLQRAEARIAEQELAMQRMVSQFEGALATLQQLEAQYDSLAADAGAADAMRMARITDLEREVEGLRVSRAALQEERDASVAQLAAALGEAEAEASEAKQQYHRAMMDAAELTEALSELRQEAGQQRGRAQAAEEAATDAREAAAAAQAALEREAAAHARATSLLDAARLHQDTARRDAQEQEQLAAQLREAAAVLEAERNDCAKAAEAAEAKVQAAGERAQLLADQLEQERQLHAQLMESRELEVAARWERALEAAQGERATLQQALDLANRQLQAAHRDTETLRLQVQHLRLEAGVVAPQPLPPRRADGAGSTHGSSPARHAGSSRSVGQRAAVTAGAAAGSRLQVVAPGSMGASEELEGSVAETASPVGSRDVFCDLQAEHHSTAAPHQQQGHRAATNAYQQQLHRHIDTLAGKLSTFQRAVEEARLVGQQASQQLAESNSMLPAELQRRQEAVADQQLQQALAAERQQFERERQRLDQQLAEQQQLLQDREAELQRMQRAEEKQRRQEQEQRQEWDWQRRQQQEVAEQQRQRELAEQQRRLHELEAASAYRSAGLPASTSSLAPPELDVPAALPLPLFGASLAGGSLGQGSSSSLLLAGTLAAAPPAPANTQRRSVSAALAAVSNSNSQAQSRAAQEAVSGGLQPSSYHNVSSESALPLPPPRTNGLMPSSGGAGKTLPLRAVMGGVQQAVPARTAPQDAGSEDPLARARRQVLAAKQYLRSVADLGGSREFGGGSGSN